MATLGKQLMDFIDAEDLHDIGFWEEGMTGRDIWPWDKDAEAKLSEWLDSHGEAIMNRIWRDKQRLEQQINHPMASLIKPTGEL